VFSGSVEFKVRERFGLEAVGLRSGDTVRRRYSEGADMGRRC
jgi:hypothetical protein